MVSMNELKQDMITGMGYIGLDSGRLYRMRRGPKLIEAVASGTTIIINDATEGRPFLGLRVFGKSTQVKTTGAQLLDESKVKQNNFRAFEYINLPVGEGTFTLSSNIPKSSTDSSAYIMLISGNVQEISPENTTATNGVYKGQSRTFPSINGYVTIAYRNDANSNNIINFNDYWYMLNKGAEEKPHEPYTGGKPSPSPEYPQEIVSAGEGGSIEIEVAGSNLLKPNNYNVFCEFPLEANTVVTLMTNGKASNGGNIKFIGTDDSNVWFGIDKGQTRVCSSIGSKPVKGFYDLLSSASGLEYMLAVGDIKTYEPYREPQTLTLQTPNGLPGVPVSEDGNYTDADGQQWVCDEIDLGRGKYMQRTDEKDVSEAIPLLWSGAGKWGNNDGYKTLAFYAYINGSNSNKNWDAVKNYGICNYAIITSNVFNNSVIGFSLGDYIAFRVPRSLLPDWDENNPSNEPWVNWLKARKEAGNPVIVRYALKTPIERDLTPEEIAAYKALRTYGPTTVVSNDAGAEMEVTYVADRKEN